MIFYLLFMPDAFCIVKSGSPNSVENYLYADIHGLYTHAYIMATTYKSATYGGTFLWKDKMDDYRNLMEDVRDIISDGDLRFFLYFNYDGGDILDHYINQFNEWFRKFGDDTLSDFDSIDDLRRPLS